MSLSVNISEVKVTVQGRTAVMINENIPVVIAPPLFKIGLCSSNLAVSQILGYRKVIFLQEYVIFVKIQDDALAEVCTSWCFLVIYYYYYHHQSSSASSSLVSSDVIVLQVMA